MVKTIICPHCNLRVIESNFCSSCGQPLQRRGEEKIDDALIELIRGTTSLISGTSKLISALGDVVEERAREGTVFKELDEALSSLGKAIRDTGDSIDQSSKKMVEMAEREIRKKKK